MSGSSGDRAPRRGGQERSVPRAAGGARGGEGRDPGRRRPPPILLVPAPAVPPCPCRASRWTWLRGEVRETARREPLPCRREGGGPLPRRALQRRCVPLGSPLVLLRCAAGGVRRRLRGVTECHRVPPPAGCWAGGGSRTPPGASGSGSALRPPGVVVAELRDGSACCQWFKEECLIFLSVC